VQPDQVAGALDLEAGGQGAGLGQVRGQGGGAGQPLAVDGGRERLELTLAGAGGGQQDADQRAGPLRHGPAERGVAGELAAGVRVGDQRPDGGPLGDRHRVDVAGQQHVVDPFDQLRLGPEHLVEQGDRDAGRRGQVGHGQPGVAALQQQPVRDLDHALLGAPGGGGPAGVVVVAGLDRAGQSSRTSFYLKSTPRSRRRWTRARPTATTWPAAACC
jgi:hypothetical protein